MTILRRGVAFRAVGFLGVFVHLGLLLLLTSWLEAHYLVATAVAVEATVVHNFLWHEHGTWVDRTRLAPGGRWIRLLRFNLATGGISIAGNLVLMRLYAGALDIEASVNGQRRQASNTRELIFPLDRLIEFISAVMTLLPGDVIATGTPSGVGPIVPGDRVAVRVAGIGELVNEVVAG